jgi:hypothetical protein
MSAPPVECHLAFLLSERSSERTVLPQFSAAQRTIGECRKDPIDGPVQESLPLVEPFLGLPPSVRPHAVQMIESTIDRLPGRNANPSSDDVSEPQASSFVAAEPVGSGLDRLDVFAGDPPVRTNGGVGKVAPITQVNNVLARAVKDLRRLTGGEQVILP